MLLTRELFSSKGRNKGHRGRNGGRLSQTDKHPLALIYLFLVVYPKLMMIDLPTHVGG
jgi:hypothetical protein